jgi:hypothetical protein
LGELGLLPANTKAATRQDVNNLGGSVGFWFNHLLMQV